MDTVIIGQGYNLKKDTSVAKELIDQFESKRYDSFTCLVAFASYGGISALTPYILREKKRGVKIRIILGIDQKGTSKDALEEVLAWGVDARIYHTRSFNIFHPKIYLFENTDIFTLIVGSNNLTENGLVKNIECSLLVKDIKSNPVHKSFYEYWKGILDGTEVNLYPITQKLINDLYADGIVASEYERKCRHDDVKDGGASSTKAKVVFKSCAVQKLPAGFLPKKRHVRIRQDLKVGVKKKVQKISVPINDDVLVAEIGGGPRWKQVNFPVQIFESFFGAQRGNNSYSIELKNVRENGTVGNPEVRQAVSVKSHNYRFEINCPETEGNYPGDDKRPVGLFVKTGPGTFLYRVLLVGHPAYKSVHDFLLRESRVRRTDELRRAIVDVEAIHALYPELVA